MRALPALAGRLAALTGWRRAVVAGGLGVLVAGAQAPVYFLPAILAFSALPWLLTGAQNGRAAFAIGWWFGFGMLTAGLYWISNALLVDSARHAWLVPFAAAGLPVPDPPQSAAVRRSRRCAPKSRACAQMLRRDWTA